MKLRNRDSTQTTVQQEINVFQHDMAGIYVRHILDVFPAAEGACPVCGSGYADMTGDDADDGCYTRHMRCRDCRSTWDARYVFRCTLEVTDSVEKENRQ